MTDTTPALDVAANGQEPGEGPDETEDGPITDGFEFRKDGTILVHVSGEEMRRLRVPRIGEYRAFRTALWHLEDSIADDAGGSVAAAAAMIRSLKEGDAEAAAKSMEEVRAERDARRSEVDRKDAEAAEWMRLVFEGGEVDGKEVKGLRDKGPKLPERDEMPLWFLTTPRNEFFTHWTTKPFRRGAR